MRRLRGNLERRPARQHAEPRSAMAVNTAELIRELEELIAALDRRIPRCEQAGEEAISRDAAALRAKASRRLAELAAHEAAGATLRNSDPT